MMKLNSMLLVKLFQLVFVQLMDYKSKNLLKFKKSPHLHWTLIKRKEKMLRNRKDKGKKLRWLSKLKDLLISWIKLRILNER